MNFAAVIHLVGSITRNMWSTGETSEFAELALGDITRDDSQRRF